VAHALLRCPSVDDRSRRNPLIGAPVTPRSPVGNEQEAMTSTRRLIRIILPLCLSLLLWHAQEAMSAESTLHSLRTGKHDEFSRLVLDLEGGRPAHVGNASETEYVIRFSSMKTSVRPESLTSRLPADIAKVSFETDDQGFQIRIVLRKKTTQEKHYFLQEKGGRYRLVVDLYVSGVTAPPEAPEKSVPPPPETTVKKKEKPPPRDRKKTDPAQPLAQPPGPPPPEAGATGTDPSDELYQVGHTLFESYQSDLREHATQIIDQYKGALKAAPNSPQAALALFRLGLSYFAVGDYKRGEECFRKILATSPRHPLTALCWMHLGRAHEQRKSPLEAIQALRTALTFPLDRPDMVETYCALGKALAQVDAHAEVIETLNKCLELDPLAYRMRPEILRLAGEAFFATKQYEKATGQLLWYLNLGDKIADSDMLLAKMAESLLYQKEPALAKRVYSYIERHHPETEGNVISKVRRAEHLEKQDGNGKEAARFIYQELTEKGLTGPLAGYVTFKLATWEKEHANYSKSLELIDQALKGNPSATSKEELLALRSGVVLEYLGQASGKKDHAQVITLYNENPALFQTPENVNALESVADSCLALKLYPNALELYKRAQNQGKKDDDLTFKIAQSYYRMGDLVGSAQQLQQVRSDKLATQKASLLGQIAFTQRQYKEAIQQFSKVLAHENEFERADVDTVFAFAESLVQTGKQAEALDLLTKAIKCPGASETPSQLQMGLLQSRCFVNLKQPDKAIASLEHLLTIGPPEHLRDQLNYRLAELYLENQQPDKAKEKLSQLVSSTQSLWKAAAQQQLNYLDMQNKGRVKTN
jgi:tetratricopeptide (TPR) repeat protein